MNEYRTTEQYNTISENAMNGNWSHAFQNCVDFGFYAQDLIEHYEMNEFNLIDKFDIAILSEGAQQLRG